LLSAVYLNTFCIFDLCRPSAHDRGGWPSRRAAEGEILLLDVTNRPVAHQNVWEPRIFSNDQHELGCSVSLISRLSDRGCLDDMDETRRLAGRWPSRRAAEGDESSCDQSPARTSQYLESRASLRSPKGSWVIGSPLFPGFLVEDVSTARVRIRTLGAGSSTASSWLSGDIFLLA
jgi:hypothetical protein